jgi:hypothetical protein
MMRDRVDLFSTVYAFAGFSKGRGGRTASFTTEWEIP